MDSRGRQGRAWLGTTRRGGSRQARSGMASLVSDRRGRVRRASLGRKAKGGWFRLSALSCAGSANAPVVKPDRHARRRQRPREHQLYRRGDEPRDRIITARLVAAQQLAWVSSGVPKRPAKFRRKRRPFPAPHLAERGPGLPEIVAGHQGVVSNYVGRGISCPKPVATSIARPRARARTARCGPDQIEASDPQTRKSRPGRGPPLEPLASPIRRGPTARRPARSRA